MSSLLPFPSFLFRMAYWYIPISAVWGGALFLTQKVLLMLLPFGFREGRPHTLSQPQYEEGMLSEYYTPTKMNHPREPLLLRCSLSFSFTKEEGGGGQWLMNQCSRAELEAPTIDGVGSRRPGTACRRKGNNLLGPIPEDQGLPNWQSSLALGSGTGKFYSKTCLWVPALPFTNVWPWTLISRFPFSPLCSGDITRIQTILLDSPSCLLLEFHHLGPHPFGNAWSWLLISHILVMTPLKRIEPGCLHLAFSYLTFCQNSRHFPQLPPRYLSTRPELISTGIYPSPTAPAENWGHFSAAKPKLAPHSLALC